MRMTTTLLAASGLVLGCAGIDAPVGEGPDDDVVDVDDRDDDDAARERIVSGTFEARSVWTLSLPIDPSRGAGDRVADILIDRIVATLGVPSQFEDEARDLVEDAVAEPIAVRVDAELPAELGRDGALWTSLAALSAEARVDSVLTLDELDGVVTGREVVTAIAYGTGDDEQVLATDGLEIDGVAIAEIATDWSATLTGEVMAVATHGFALSFRPLADAVAREVVGVGLDELLALDAVVDCDAIVDEVADGGFSVSYYGVGYQVSEAEIAGLCRDALVRASAEIYAVFDVDLGVEAGGSVLIADLDGDRTIDALASGADFGGPVHVSGVHAADARIAFAATRR